MSCKCCGASSSDLCYNKCSSSSSSSSEESSGCEKRTRRGKKKCNLPTAWEPGVDGYYEDYNSGQCNKIEACHNAGCQRINKHYINKKNCYCYPKVSANLVKSCDLQTCLVQAQCVKAIGAEIGDLNVKGRLFLNGKDINNEEDSVLLSNHVGQIEVIPERPQDALTLPLPTLVPQGIFSPVLPGIDLPYYVSLYHIPDRQGIRGINELKQLYSSILLLNTAEVIRQVAFVLFIYSANNIPFDENFPARSFVLQPLDIDIQTMPPGALKTFNVNWNSWRSCLNVIGNASEVAIFTSVMVVGEESHLAFLRTFTTASEALSHRIYAIYNNYCCKEDNYCKKEKDCNSSEELV